MALHYDNNILEAEAVVVVVVVGVVLGVEVHLHFYHKTHSFHVALLEYHTQLQPYPYQQLP
jgi:hypothetical protein